MDLESLAAWGEFVGGVGGLLAAIAVIASLVFVGVQIRASVRQSRVDSYSTITELWTNFTNATVATEDAWRVFYTGIRDYESLTEMEQARFDFLISMYFGIHDTVMVHESLGVWQNAETYERTLEQSYRMFLMPGVQSWWQKNRGRVFAPRVEAYVVSRAQAEGRLD